MKVRTKISRLNHAIRILIYYFTVCEYYVHMDCQDFAVADCKSCATYVPDKELVSVLTKSAIYSG